MAGSLPDPHRLAQSAIFLTWLTWSVLIGSQTERACAQAVRAGDPAAGAGPLSPVQGEAPASGDALLERAIVTLEGRRSVMAVLPRQRDLFRQQPVGWGFMPRNAVRGLLFRLELRTQVGGQQSNLLVVCDGPYVWTYRKSDEGETLVCVDVLRVARALEAHGRCRHRVESAIGPDSVV